MIQFENIKLGYGSRTLIANLSAKICAGELTALVGRNGTGKSTLLRAIAGLGDIVDGKIIIDGKDITSLTAPEMATRVAFVTTDKVRITNLRCRDVVALGRWDRGF